MIVNDQDPAQTLVAIIQGPPPDVTPQQHKNSIPEVEKINGAENLKKSERLQKILAENKAIRDGLESAKQITGDSLSALTGISEELRQARDLAKEVATTSFDSAVVREYSNALSKISTTIDHLSQQVKVLEIDGSESESESSVKAGFASGRVSSTDLGLVNREVNSSDGAREAEATASKALAETQLKQAAASGLVNHLESQLANLDESIVKGVKALSSITDGNLLIKTSENSQLDSALYTSVLVQQEALQQNRWVGRALNLLQ